MGISTPHIELLNQMLDEAQARIKELEEALEGVVNDLESDKAPLDDTWWHSDTETKLEYLQTVLALVKELE